VAPTVPEEIAVPSSDQRPTPGSGLLPKGRLEAFSDGVLAIVITIIVLELEVPERAEGSDLARALVDEWRSFAAYLISFVFVGGFWISHASATRLVGRVDGIFMRLNLVALFFVSFLPFTTSVMATHLDGEGEHVAVALYGVNLLVASLVLSALISYAATAPGVASDGVADHELVAAVRGRRLLVAVQAAATALAVLLPALAVGVYLAVSLGFIAGPLFQARRPRR
jgi:uncharacterized membrane protein